MAGGKTLAWESYFGSSPWWQQAGAISENRLDRQAEELEKAIEKCKNRTV